MGAETIQNIRLQVCQLEFELQITKFNIQIASLFV